MRNYLLAAVFGIAGMVPGFALANDFPTTARLEYVMRCMEANSGKHEYLYKCSCAVDRIADAVKYQEYEEISAAHQYAPRAGARVGQLKNSVMVQEMAARYASVEKDARRACFIQD